MTDRDIELLSRFIDGELERAEAQALRQRLLAEPELRSQLDRMKAVNNRVVQAFQVEGADAVPASVAARLQPRKARRHTWGLAVAATVVAAAGLMLAPQWQQEQDGNGDPLLANVLEVSTSRADGWDSLADGRKVRPVLSFSNQEGNWCREYLLSADGRAFRGVACRSDGQWRTEVLSAVALDGPAGEYRPAGAADADSVASYIHTHAADIPLSLQQESDLIARNWD